MARDPDFILTVDGVDLTKYVMAWDISENDDTVSSISVQLANPDMKLSGSIPFGGELSLVYGYAEITFDTVYASIRSITEDYALGNPNIKIKAECAVAELHENSVMGHSKKGQSPSDAAIEAAKQKGVSLVFKDLENPPTKKYQKIPAMPMSLHSFITQQSSIMQGKRPTWGSNK